MTECDLNSSRWCKIHETIHKREDETSTPQLTISLHIDHNCFSKSNAFVTRMKATTTLQNPDLLTVETFGEHYINNILSTQVFRLEWFDFIDVETGEEIVNPDPTQHPVDPGDVLHRQNLVELRKDGPPHETGQVLDDMDPLSAMLNQLTIGRTYQLRLKPQTVLGFEATVEQILDGEEQVERRMLVWDVKDVVLRSDDEPILMIVE